jgi:hypothetical protein
VEYGVRMRKIIGINKIIIGILLFKGILDSYYKGLTLSAYKKTRIKLINPRDHKENKNVQDLNDWRIKYFKN